MKFFQRKLPQLIALLTALCGCFALENSMAQEKAKETEEKPEPSAEDLAWIEELTSVPPGPYLEMKPATVHFNLSWNNVLNAGEIAFELNDHLDGESDLDDVFVGTAKGRSSGLARVLWPYDVEAKAIIDPKTLRPHLFELSETERGKSVDYVLDFQPGKVVSETTVLAKKEGEEAETRRKVYRFEPLHDILTIALYIRSLELAEGDTLTALVSPFNRPYHAEFTLAGKETRKIRGEKIDTLKFDVVIRKVNSDKTLQTYDKMKKATIWFSDDEFRLPIEIHADIFIGFVSARMTERDWITEPGAAAEPATTEKKKKKGGLSRFFEDTKKSLFGKKPASSGGKDE